MIGNIIFAIVVVLFIVNGVKRMLEALAREAQKDAPQRRDAEAKPSEVEEFLRSLQQARRQQQGQVQARPPQQAQVQARPARPQAPMRPRAAAAVPVVEEALFVGPASPPRRAAPAAPAVRPRRVRPRRKQDDDVVEELVAKEPLKEAPPQPKAAAVALPALQKIGLKEAIIWSEILGPPLSKRPRRGGPAGGGLLRR